MYAINGTSYRAISRAEDVQPGETLAETLPRSLFDAIQAGQDESDGNAATLRDRADAALANLRAYRDLASPTGAQTVAAVKLLCRVAIVLIRLQLRKLDATE